MFRLLAGLMVFSCLDYYRGLAPCPGQVSAGVGELRLYDLGSDDPTDPSWPHPGRSEHGTLIGEQRDLAPDCEAYASKALITGHSPAVIPSRGLDGY